MPASHADLWLTNQFIACSRTKVLMPQYYSLSRIAWFCKPHQVAFRSIGQDLAVFLWRGCWASRLCFGVSIRFDTLVETAYGVSYTPTTSSTHIPKLLPIPSNITSTPFTTLCRTHFSTAASFHLLSRDSISSHY